MFTDGDEDHHHRQIDLASRKTGHSAGSITEFAGSLYHVTARDNRREDIYLDDADRVRFLALLTEVCERFNWLIHAYCLMTNHYHLVVETPDGNLSKGLRQLTGVYTRGLNRRHGRVEHVFQGRFKAILV